jgi:TPR repeat protein
MREKSMFRKGLLATAVFVALLALPIDTPSAQTPRRATGDLSEGIEALKRSDYATAARELRPVAEGGDAEAQYRIGLMYEWGKGYPLNKPEGISWFRKSAAQGHPAAQLELGVIFANGEGVPADGAQAVSWFRKAAMQGNPTAQYNLGLMYAKGNGISKDNAQAIAWIRKAADQGLTIAQFKLGVAYENGEGVVRDKVLAYANYAIAARDGNDEYVKSRDDVARQLTPEELREGKALAAAWDVGKPTLVREAAARDRAATLSASSPHQDKCSASGLMEGSKFAANNCAIALYGDQHSVAIWFSEDPISAEDLESFQTSAYAVDTKDGKRHTQLQIMFCPGGGSPTASAAATKSIDLNTNHANSPLAGVQWVVEAPKDFKVEKMTGDLKPGGTLSGKIVGSKGKTTWALEFDLKLPAKDAAAGMTCGK